MPSKSKSQFRLFSWAKCVKSGKCKDAPENVKNLAKTMSMKELDDFLNTQMSNLPDLIKKESIHMKNFKEFVNEALSDDWYGDSSKKPYEDCVEQLKWIKKSLLALKGSDEIAWSDIQEIIDDIKIK